MSLDATRKTHAAWSRCSGLRFGRKLELPTSRDTLLCLVRHAPLPTTPTPSVLSIDDWASHKRQIYGTVLIDLEQRRPVALLPDCEADTLATWLHDHPRVEVISRDRGGTYAKGACDGVPLVVQVADRFHRQQDLAETLGVVFVDWRVTVTPSS